MKYGALDIEKVYLGSQELDKIYYGTSEVYSKSSPGGGGIDEHTLALFHVNDSDADDGYNKNITTVTGSSGCVYGTGKFDKGIYQGSITLQYPSGSYPNLNDTFTLDYWLYTSSTNNSDAKNILIRDENGSPLVQMRAYYSTMWTASFIAVNIQNVEKYFAQTNALTPDTWHHIALEIGSGTLTVYVDGTSVGTTTGIATMTGLSRIDVTAGTSSQSPNDVLDEIRVSNVLRYNGNFTPPTGPYN